MVVLNHEMNTNICGLEVQQDNPNQSFAIATELCCFCGRSNQIVTKITVCYRFCVEVAFYFLMSVKDIKMRSPSIGIYLMDSNGSERSHLNTIYMLFEAIISYVSIRSMALLFNKSPTS